MQDLDQVTLTAIQQILQHSWRCYVTITDVEELRANKAYRLFIVAESYESMLPNSVIIKKVRPTPDHPYDPDATTWNPGWRFLEEWAGVEFLSSLDGVVQHGPRFIGANRTVGVLVMEDFGTAPNLADLLMSTDTATAEQALIWHAEAVAQLHGDTIGRYEQYHAIRVGLGPLVRQSDAQAWCNLSQAYSQLLAGFTAIGVRPASGFEQEYQAMSATITNPGPFFAYTHCDPCPDNTILRSDRLQLFDFERSGYHHALLDAVYGRLGFPTCFFANRLPEQVVLTMEHAYRHKLAPQCPAVLDDQLFYRDLVHVCAYWLISNKNWLLDSAYDEDIQWGIATWQQRVMFRLGIFVDLTKTYDELPAMGQTAQQCLNRLQQIWPAEVHSLPLFPAFR